MDALLRLAFPGVKSWSQLAALAKSPEEQARYEQALEIKSALKSGASLEPFRQVFSTDAPADLSPSERYEFLRGKDADLVKALLSLGLRPVICKSPRGRWHLSGVSDEYYFTLIAPGFYFNLAGEVVNRFGMPLTASEAEFFRLNYGPYEPPEHTLSTDSSNILILDSNG